MAFKPQAHSTNEGYVITVRNNQTLGRAIQQLPVGFSVANLGNPDRVLQLLKLDKDNKSFEVVGEVYVEVITGPVTFEDYSGVKEISIRAIK